MSDNNKAMKAQRSVVLRLIGVRRRFVGLGGAIDVLNGASLTLRSGEAIALLGPSGSGKSTLLHIAGLLEMPSRGRVEIEGCASSDLSDRRRSELRRQRIGFVYQFHHLMDEFSAVENVMIPQMIGGLGRRQARSRAEQLLAMVRLTDRFDHRPAELSGGERQRVAIARALANAPVILLADEPTGNLDNRTAEQVFSMLMTLAREIGLAMLIATHNLELTRYMDRIVVLKNGVLVSP